MELLQLMKSRYSVRDYKSTKIEKDKLDIILEAGRVAPTGANRQTHKILIIDTKTGIEKISKSARTNNAPLIMIICSERDKSWVNPYDGRDMNDTDCSIVTTHMMLMAKSLGVDSLWINWFDPEVLYKEFNIPREYKITNLLELGYSNVDPLSADRHDTTRKPLVDTVFYNNF